MKQLKYITLLSALFFLSSCFEDPGTEILWEGGSFVELDAATTASATRDYSYLRLNDGTTYSSGMNVLLASASNSGGVTVNFEIDASSTAIEGVHYTTSGTSVNIPAGSFVGELPFTILADNMNPGEVFTLVINITSADVEIGERSSATHNISIQCPSELAGMIDYQVLSNDWGGANDSGTMEWIELGANGVYTWDTYTFGAYQTLYACCEQTRASSILNVTDVCSSLSITPADGFGCTWSLTVDSVTGDTMVVTLSGDCFGNTQVQFTRQDGATWNVIP